MKIRALDVRRMPGFEAGGFRLDGLGEGLNVCVGPNGSGKTTACRALRGLLWPESLRGVSPVSLHGEWSGEGQLLVVDLEGTRCAWQREGAAAGPPPLPPPHLGRCFTITVDDLFAGSATDRGLAERVVQLMAGGYDLGALRRGPELSLSRRHGRDERARVLAGQRLVRDLQIGQESLRRDEDQLAELEAQAQQARHAEARLGRLADVRALIDLRGQLARTQSILASFPAGIERLRGNEGEALQQIQDDLAANRRTLATESANAADAAERLKATGLPDGGIPDAALTEQAERLEQLRGLEGRTADVDRRLAEAEQRVADALRRLGDATEADKADALSAQDMDQVERFHREREAAAARQAAVAGRLEDLGDEEQVEADAGALSAGAAALRQWLRSGGAEPTGRRRRLLWLAWGLAALVVCLGVALGVAVSAAWVLLVLPAAAAAVAAWMLARDAAPSASDAAKAQYEHLRLPSPSAWDPPSVAGLLDELERSMAEARDAARRNEERRVRRRDLAEAQAANEALAARRARLVERVGLAPGTSDLALAVLAAALVEYQRARTQQDACRVELGRLREGHARVQAEVNGFLDRFGAERCDGHGLAVVRSNEIAARARAYLEAATARAAAERAAGDARSRVAALEERRVQLLAGAGLGDGDEEELNRRLDRRAEYQAAVDTRNELRANEAQIRQRLADAPDLLELTQEEADELAARLTEEAGRYRSLVERIKGIRDQVERAGGGTALEDALATLAEARDLLSRRRADAVRAAVGNLLLDQVEAEHQVESRPPVLQQAAAWFSRFTRGRYELRVDDRAADGAPAFRAFDTEARRGLALDELSRGTRMQLLLAVRLAFAASAERGTQLPFVLDEVLSTSDPERFRAVVRCLLDLVAEGRQVLYFTCQPGDAAAWQQVAGETGASEPKRFELVPGKEPRATALLTESAAAADSVPEPGDLTLADYARRLGVPALAPTAGAASAHVAHLLDDPADLCRLLRLGCERYGPLDSLASHGHIQGYLADDALTRARARACVLDAFAEAWAIGRGRPLDRETLQAAGVSATMIDRTCDLAGDLGWDAKRLVRAIDERSDERARHFHARILESVREYLTDERYLDDRDPLDEEAARERVLVAVRDLVRRGEIGAAEVGALFDTLWQLSAQP